MWKSKNKYDLMIEVWEKLDCESVGAPEIAAIEAVVRDVFGEPALDSPMRMARILADEGAELRHSEIMQLYVERYENQPYTAEFRNILKLDNLKRARSSIRNLENLRRKFLADNDREGVRLIRERTIDAKKELKSDTIHDLEIARWLTVWLQTPELFEDWLKLRARSNEFLSAFGEEILK